MRDDLRSVYAAVFFLVNATYVALIFDLVGRASAGEVSFRERKIMRIRSVATLAIFALAAGVALRFPIAGLAMCCGCLIVYLKPEAPGGEDHA
ncbi:hypothetical protein QRQ56_24705 [Bradyrhizobium sp. U531]|uniref:hypothetical protein n=1 Tax=Bradyrhizobium sp. U531 TaxID=3053458 RepID=UPI003F421F3B